MRTRKTAYKSVISILLIVTGCAVYKVVNYDYDKNVDFTQYKTFAWLPDNDTLNTRLDNHIVRNNIKNYITQEFKDKYKMQPEVNYPDLLLKIIINNKQKEETQTSGMSNPMGPNYYNMYNFNNPYPMNGYVNSPYYSAYPNQFMYGGMGFMNYSYSSNYVTQNIDYTQNTITLHAIDRKRKELVWSATALGDIYDSRAYNIEKEIHPAVEKLMSYFPLKEKN